MEIKPETFRPRAFVRRQLGWGQWLRGGFVSLAVLCGAVGILLYSDPTLIPQAVDIARGVIGPQPVALLESWVFQARDQARRIQYQTTGNAPALAWAGPTPIIPHVSAAPASAPATPPPDTATSAALSWAPFVFTPVGSLALERAIVTPDPARPYVDTALVRIDLKAAQLHLLAGTQEPISTVKLARPGLIPAADQRNSMLLAAFNGGFKAANGAFGMGVDNTVLLAPVDGLATLAIYRDGHVQLGSWGTDITASPNIAAWRQNCPLLLAGGKPTADTELDDPKLWGHTVGNKIATWRSGLGLSADGRYLIYAAGDDLTVPALAQALALGGASRAMQLDINSWWVRFVTYTTDPTTHRPTAQKLLTDMIGDKRQFLIADSRDFFYVTAR